MPGASEQWETDELRSGEGGRAWREESPLTWAIRKFLPSYSEPSLDIDLSHFGVPETMDPEIRNTVMGFGPGQLPTAAGVFTCNIINAIRKHFVEGYPITGGKRHLDRVMEMLKEIPQSVIDRIDDFAIREGKVSYPISQGGTATAQGAYHPMGRRHQFKKYVKPGGEPYTKEMKELSPRQLPQVEIAGLGEGRGGQDLAGTILHETGGHSILDAIRRKVGWKGATQLSDVAAKDPFYKKYLKTGEGYEEPFAYMVEDMSPKEFRELLEPYLAPLKEKGVRFPPYFSEEKALVQKAIHRAAKRAKKSKQTFPGYGKMMEEFETPPEFLAKSTTKTQIPSIEGLKYNGIQEIPNYPDQYVFTDLKTGGTFYTKDPSKSNLLKERDRVRKAFEAGE